MVYGALSFFGERDAHDIFVAVVTAFIITGIIAIYRRVNHNRDDLRKIIQAFEGVPANPYSGTDAVPGIGERVHKAELADQELRIADKRANEQIDTICEQVAEINEQLTTFNGGSTIKAGLRDVKATTDKISAHQTETNKWLHGFISVWQHNVDKARESGMEGLDDAPPFPPTLNATDGNPV